MSIKERIANIKKNIPPHVKVLAACKSQPVDKIFEVIDAGITLLGHNYVQEAVSMLKNKRINKEIISVHMIGHLQTNKVKQAVKIFNTIETIDSLKKAESINKAAKLIDKSISVFIEINIAKEQQKYGIFPEDLSDLVLKIKDLPNLKLEGLMTMGPNTDIHTLRNYFKKMNMLFKKTQELHEIKYLSMGMSNSYMPAIEEGANIIRLGRIIFGERIK